MDEPQGCPKRSLRAMTAPQSGQDPTGHGARDSAVATPPEKNVMKFEGGTLALLLFGSFISGLALLAGTIPFAGLALTGYAFTLLQRRTTVRKTLATTRNRCTKALLHLRGKGARPTPPSSHIRGLRPL